MQYKNFPGFCYSLHTRPPDTHSFAHTLADAHIQKPTVEDKEISERVAERDRREVQEANVTTVSISSKLDLFLFASWKTLRLAVVLCFHHPEAPHSGACWVPTWHQEDQVAARQVYIWESGIQSTFTQY